jgi:glycosyltransferase involved in cell wall biosynthesis
MTSDLGWPSHPTISVCIPTLNGASTIVECVQSVLTQSFTNFELIISDDRSTDETLDLVRSFGDPRILIVNGPATGSAEQNWNFGVSAARGQFIKVMGQDDVLYSKALETELSMFEVHSDVGVVMTFSKRDLISPTGRLLPRFLSLGRRFPTICNLDELLPRIVRSGRNPLGEPVCVTVRRDVLEKINGFSGTYLIDLTTWIRLLEHGSGAFINTPQCAFRISRRSWSYTLRQSQARQTRSFVRSLRTRFPSSVSNFDVIVGSISASFAQLVRGLVVSFLPRDN